ncbi:MAG: hypothetical protein LQ341_001986 [Variospora aurantia]|nr:MAG: hypothetical protein LQ341_001986 [Variospora aurantia]
MGTSKVIQSNDPWEWTVDEVVAALCDPVLHFRAAKANPQALPDATILEEKLREHYIEGCSLLTDIDHATLKEEFQIAAVGQRGHILREIVRLRWKSDRYSKYIQQRSHRPPLDIQDSQPWLNQLSDVQESFAPAAAPDAVAEGFDPPLPGVAAEHLSSSQGQPAYNETVITDEDGRKRRRLVISTATPVIADASGLNAVDSECLEQTDTLDPTAVAGSPVPSDVDRNIGPKRIAPTLIHQPGEESSTHGGPITEPQRKSWEAYLGVKALPVDDVFYERTRSAPKTAQCLAAHIVLNDDGASNDFMFINTRASNGQRQYIKSRIHHFLQQKPQLFCRGTKRCYGILPYPEVCGSKYQSLSITVFEATPNGVVAVRRDRTGWLPLNDEGSVKLHQYSNDLDAEFYKTPVSIGEDTGADWDYLEKWHHAPGHENILPVYGESGSEAEYDLSTWREIEREQGAKLPRPLGRSKLLKKLSEDDIFVAIDEATNRMVGEWRQKKLPKLLRTAWMLWSKSRRNRTKEAQISSLTYDVQYLNRRLDKLRQEIAKEKWISVGRISRQCESMRRTIYELEETNWKISILQMKVRPERSQPLLKTQAEGSRSSVDQRPELETSLTETSADEDLDGFIVDDDAASAVPDDTSMAGVEIPNAAFGDDGTLADTVDFPRSARQFIAGEAPADSLPLKTLKEEETPSCSTFKPANAADLVDLTLDTDESEPEAHLIPKTPVTMQAESVDEDPIVRSQRKKAMFRIPPVLPNVVDLGEDPAYDSAPEGMTPLKLPALYETAEIGKMDTNLLMERSDRKRLLIWLLTRYNRERRGDAYLYIIEHDRLSAQEGVWRTLKNIRGYRRKIRGTQNVEESETLKAITAWFVCWTNAVIVRQQKGANKEQLDVAEADKEGFEPFYHYLHELQCLLDFEDPGSGSSTAVESPDGGRDGSNTTIPTLPLSETTPSKSKRVLMEYSDEDLQPTPAAKKRKYIVPESQEAADLRKRAHKRVSEREMRQRTVKKRLERMGHTEEDPSQVPVNLGKLENQELIYLPATIGARIQPHQKDGVNFLWREIIEDHATKQGCLLAQTMGLGKTMQVISFLVAVARAAKSSNANICDQIPQRLRESKTIVLCPPALIDNWYEEFLIWAPDDMTESIGDIRKVDSSMAPHERLQTIEEWGEEGGVLVLGFSVLRELINNTAKKKMGQTPLDSDQHQKMTDILLKQPNIVVADEAHAAKNRNSKLHQILLRFTTGSRIALTGSPLSNNLSEYYALIEWVAPGYLGDHREFRAHYEEPIQQGLYRDSTASQWRTGLKRLEVFKREVQPKVHRADVSVLASRLKGKSEFVIKLALTPLQEEIYQIFVNSMREQYQGSEGPHQATLWGWISTLRLVCNHPKCFYDKLNRKDTTKARKKRPKKQSSAAEELGIADEDEAFEDASPVELGMSENLIQRQLQPFGNVQGPLDAVSLAYKMTILLQILEFSSEAGDKVLVFSHSLPTLSYVGRDLTNKKRQFLRLDGGVPTAQRQQMTKDFNEGPIDIFLVSTRAGGTGLNLYGANRVVILDDHFNPTWEEQAVGRAYRIGQQKHVYVYRLTAGGTFEEALLNQSLFKKQLATRAVDKRNIARQATRTARDYFQPLKTVAQTDLEPMKGKDPAVLDKILEAQAEEPYIRAIVPCETFQQEVDENLTAEEQREVEHEEELSRLRRTDPAAYHAKLARSAVPRPQFQAGLLDAISSSPHFKPNRPLPSTGARCVSETAGLFSKLASQGVDTLMSQVPRAKVVSWLESERVYGSPRPYSLKPKIDQMHSQTQARDPNANPEQDHALSHVGTGVQAAGRRSANTGLPNGSSMSPPPTLPKANVRNALDRAVSEPSATAREAEEVPAPDEPWPRSTQPKYTILAGLLDREKRRRLSQGQ